MASPAAASQSPEGTKPQRWASKLRSRPGARFRAISAASMQMVPLPQKGSQKGSLPRNRDRVTIAAASVSRRGASTPTARYPRLYRPSPEVSRQIMASSLNRENRT